MASPEAGARLPPPFSVLAVEGARKRVKGSISWSGRNCHGQCRSGEWVTGQAHFDREKQCSARWVAKGRWGHKRYGDPPSRGSR